MLANRLYEFGEFRFAPKDRVLFRNGELVSLTPKVFDTLRVLVENHGHTLEKSQLLQEIWPDTFVEEGTLTRNIYVLRRALGDSTEGSEYIVTIPKHGYRFVAPVVERDTSVSAPVSAVDNFSERRAGDEKIALPIALYRSRRPWIVALAILSVGIFGAYLYANRFWAHAPHPGKVTLAVLPFANLTGDPAQEFISDGLTEEMITQLGRLNYQQLNVIARTSAMTYKGANKPINQIGRELGVTYVLEGSLRRWGDRVRISAQLVQTHDQTHLWARNFESDVRDILKLQSDVAQAVAQEISLTLTPQERARVASASRIDPQVYELCLRGRYEWNKRTEAGLNKAISYFQQAISRQSYYAPAYAGLADAYAVLPYFSEASANDSLQNAKSAAERALQLDETLVEAHATLGLIEATCFNFAAAEHEYRRALELNSNYATVHHWYSYYLWNTNQKEEALVEMERARQLDPLSLIVNTDEGRMLSSAHQPDRAVGLLRTVLELDQNFAEAHRALALAYMQKGQVSLAISEAHRGLELDPNDSEQATLGYVYAAAGKVGQARKVLAELSKRPTVSPVYLSFIYIGLAEKDHAFACLERAYRERSLMLSIIQTETIFDPLRSDSRFHSLLRRAAGYHDSPAR
jgi:TolB-like protein/DNA-binding winged helix-turn-helix (wHTH) protein/Tfp pilus assembly protein PilF